MRLFCRKILLAIFINFAWFGGAFADVPDHTGNECSDVHVSAFESLAEKINDAIAPAEIDVADHGETGAYASASNANLDYLNRALEKVYNIVNFLNSNNPAVTTYAEAGMVETNIRDAMNFLQYGSYWASISAVYHEAGLGYEGSDAYQSFEASAKAMDTAHVLRAKARRCYMDAYLY